MGTIADKLTYLNQTKTDIKQAIIAKGVAVADTDTFRSYATKIGEIPSGGTPIPNTYTITFNDGTTAIGEIVVAENAILKFNPYFPTKTGYFFTGWQLNGVAITYPYTVTENQTWTTTFVTYRVYGVSGEAQLNPTLTRTDDAVGLAYTVGLSEIQSDFDTCYPWSDIVEWTDNMGNKFMKIPKFYNQYTFDSNNLKTTKICNAKLDNSWVLNPIFTDGNGNELDYFCIGKYDAGSSGTKLTSISGVSPLVNQTRATFRTYARNNGTGYQQLDIWAVTALQDLFKVEFATLNSQSIMMGYTNGGAVLVTGGTDNIPTASGSPNSNTSGAYPMEYRGIENFYGNVYQWVDGFNINASQSYVCYNPTNYTDDTSENYTALSYTNSSADEYVVKLGYDSNNPFANIPVSNSGGSSSTYYSDAYYHGSSRWCVALFGGHCCLGARAGAFYWHLSNTSSVALSRIGGRLLYKPL